MRFCILANVMDKSALLKKINERNRGTLMQTLKIEFTDIGDDFLTSFATISHLGVPSKLANPNFFLLQSALPLLNFCLLHPGVNDVSLLPHIFLNQ